MGGKNSKTSSSLSSLALYSKEEIGKIVADFGEKFRPYEKLVVENGVDGELLASFTEEEFIETLDELGITARLHRKKLIRVFQNATTSNSNINNSKSSTRDTVAVSKTSMGATSSSSLIKGDDDGSTVNHIRRRVSITTTPTYHSTTCRESCTEESSSERSTSSSGGDPAMDESLVLLDGFLKALDHRQSQQNKSLAESVRRLRRLSLEDRTYTGPPSSGKVAIVHTDVVGSTSLWEAHPTAMRQALVLHDKIQRQVAATFFAYEVDTEGDAFFWAFHDASNAVSFAVSLQEAMNAAPWGKDILRALPPSCQGDEPNNCRRNAGVRRGPRVRVSVSYGSAETCQNPVTGRTQYVGHAWHSAKDLIDVAMGGQILTTEEAWQAARQNFHIGHRELPKAAYLGVSYSGCTSEKILEVAPPTYGFVYTREQCRSFKAC